MFLRAEQLNVSGLKNRKLVFKINRKELDEKITVKVKSVRGCSWVQQPASSLTSFTLKKSLKKCVLSWHLKDARESH